jgi:hypothetical protein
VLGAIGEGSENRFALERLTFFIFSKFIGVLIFLFDFSNSASAYAIITRLAMESGGKSGQFTASMRLGLSVPSASSQWAMLGERWRRTRERREKVRLKNLSAIACSTTE